MTDNTPDNILVPHELAVHANGPHGVVVVARDEAGRSVVMPLNPAQARSLVAEMCLAAQESGRSAHHARQPAPARQLRRGTVDLPPWTAVCDEVGVSLTAGQEAVGLHCRYGSLELPLFVPVAALDAIRATLAEIAAALSAGTGSRQ